ncbi:MAG: prephenate dehydrogenase/arogenate dehydrogenase family protein [Dehalococcoidia bacterium]
MRVAILGTGLIGSSIGLRLRRDPSTDTEVVGFDRYTEVARQAQRAGAIDTAAHTPEQAVEGADLVILAAPVLAIRKLLEEIAPVVSREAIITDTGSTKTEVMRWAQELLPAHTGFVGGHPMAGKTETGPDAADPDLFEGARWIVVPAVRTTEGATNGVLWLADRMGATTIFMDAAEHDAYAAAVSHMPMVAATALFSMEHASEAWPELSELAAGGFKDMTRLAGTDAAMAYDIIVTNREQTIHWLDRYLVALREMRDQLADPASEQDLFKLIAGNEFEYVAYRNGKVGREEKNKSPDMSGYTIQDFLMGGWAKDKIDEIARSSEERVRENAQSNRDRRDV